MKYYLSVISIFKNECSIIKEWLEHYLLEGVDHFYLIDNGSTDNYKEILKPYMTEGLIDLIVDDRPHMQVAHYNSHYLLKSKEETEWIMVVDFDEFIYSRHNFETIKRYLVSLDENIAQVYVPWKMFGSNGYIEHPSECISSFTKRCKYGSKKMCGMHVLDKILTKTLTRTRYLLEIGIHFSRLCKDKSMEITSDSKPIPVSDTKWLQAINERILLSSYLHCNHYPIQSFSWFKKIKMTRGSASTVNHDKIRTIEYYNEYDMDCILDDHELANKHNLRIYYGQNKLIDVTRKVLNNFRNGNMIIINSNCVLNKYFGDPEPFTPKYLLIRQNNKIKIYTENNRDTIIIKL